MKRKLINYSNATKIRLKNKRLNIYTLDKKEIIIDIISLSEKNEVNKPRAIHLNLKDKAVSTSFKITREMALSLVYGLENELKKHEKINID